MPFEDHAEHVVCLAFEPVCAVPDRNQRGNRLTVVESGLQPQPAPVRDRVEMGDNIEPGRGAHPQHVDRGQVGQEVEQDPVVVAQVEGDLAELLAANVDGGFVAKADDVEEVVGVGDPKDADDRVLLEIIVDPEVAAPLRVVAATSRRAGTAWLRGCRTRPGRSGFLGGGWFGGRTAGWPGRLASTTASTTAWGSAIGAERSVAVVVLTSGGVG